MITSHLDNCILTLNRGRGSFSISLEESNVPQRWASSDEVLFHDSKNNVAHTIFSKANNIKHRSSRLCNKEYDNNDGEASDKKVLQRLYFFIKRHIRTIWVRFAIYIPGLSRSNRSICTGQQKQGRTRLLCSGLANQST